MRIIHVLRKPLSEGTVAANTLKHGVGAYNIDAVRVAHESDANLEGRWPANMILQHLDGCGEVCEPGCPVVALNEQSGASRFFKQVGGK